MSASRFIEMNALYYLVDYLIDDSPMAATIDQARLGKFKKDCGFRE